MIFPLINKLLMWKESEKWEESILGRCPKRSYLPIMKASFLSRWAAAQALSLIPESYAGRQSPGNEARWWAVLHLWFVDWPSFPGSCLWPAVASMEERRDLFTLTCLICPVNCIQNCLVYPPSFSFPFQYLWFFQIIKELIYLLKPIREPENKVLRFTFNNHLDIRQTLGDFQFIKVQNYKCFILWRTAIN